VISAPYVQSAGRLEVHPATTRADAKIGALPAVSALIAIMFLGVGLAFTVCELKRLSATDHDDCNGPVRIGVANAEAADECREDADERVDGGLVA
jgi:hypothetical protein